MGLCLDIFFAQCRVVAINTVDGDDGLVSIYSFRVFLFVQFCFIPLVYLLVFCFTLLQLHLSASLMLFSVGLGLCCKGEVKDGS